jgi:hypothetical protein
MKSEYEVLIEDLNPPEDKTIKMSHALKRTIQRTINKRLRSNLAETLKEKGVEIDVPPEWEDILHEDSTLLGDYEKIGWKIMWYNRHSLGPGRGELVRSWLRFRSEANASKER